MTLYASELDQFKKRVYLLQTCRILFDFFGGVKRENAIIELS